MRAGLSGKYEVTRGEFNAAYTSGALDFLNGIADLGLTRRNSQVIHRAYLQKAKLLAQRTASARRARCALCPVRPALQISTPAREV